MATRVFDRPPIPVTSHRCRRPSAAVVVPSVVSATLTVCLLLRCGPVPVTATTCDVQLVGTGEDDDWRPPSTVEVVLRAQSVIYGRVRRTVPDQSYDFGFGTSVYTAEMEVYCTLKGRRLDRVVNVSKAGNSLLSLQLTVCREFCGIIV